MKFHIREKIKYARGIQFVNYENCVLRVLDRATLLFEKENFEPTRAYREANKLVFSFPHHLLNGATIAQYLAGGGEEVRALEAIKDYIQEAKVVKIEKVEVKTVTARVFRSG